MGSCSSKPKTSEFDGAMDQILESNKPTGEPICKELHLQKKIPPQILSRSTDKDGKFLPSPVEVENGISANPHDEVLPPTTLPISEFITREQICKPQKVCESFPDNDELVSQKETVVVEATVIEAPEFVKERIISTQEDPRKEQPTEPILQKPEAFFAEVVSFAVGSKRASTEDMQVEKSLHVVCDMDLQKGRDASLLVYSEKAEAQTYRPTEDMGSRRKYCTSEDEVERQQNSDGCCLPTYKCSRGGLQNVSKGEGYVVRFLKSTDGNSHGSFAGTRCLNHCNEFKENQGFSESNIQKDMMRTPSNVAEEQVKEVGTVKKPPEAKTMDVLDIEEVLEKLASEFERQESLSLSSRS